MVFFLNKKINSKFEKMIIGLSAGVMLSSSIWSLIIPSLEMRDGLLGNSLISTALGMVIGVAILIVIDNMFKMDDKNYNLKRMFNVMTIHNIPEGIVVGISCSLILINNTDSLLFVSFLSLALGISLQNFPEGLVVSFPFYINGYSKTKSFIYGFLSGAVEPIFSIITIILSFVLYPILPILLSISAGMMVYVVMFELIPEIITNEKNDNNFGVFGFTFGFILMMILDHII